MKENEKNSHSTILEVSDSENVELVDLIDRPAWKTILIDLVKSEKMNPWDINIVELADKYLKKIALLGGTDLRVPANAILASAIMLKFKSEILNVSPIEEEIAKDNSLTEEQKKELEELLPELRVINSSRQGKVSLDDLVLSLEKILDKTKNSPDKRALGSKDVIEFKLPYSTYNIEEMTKKVFEEINQKADSTGMVLFSRLVEGKNPLEIIDTFIPCLFLSNKQKINMWQEEFFGEIFISIQKN